MSYPQDPQYPSQWEPPRPRKRSRAGLWAALIALDLLAVGLVYFIVTNRAGTANAGDGRVAAGETRSGEGWDGGTGPSPEPEPEPAKIGDKVRDGDFSMKVTKISRVERLGSDDFDQMKAKGEYLVVHLTVRSHHDKRRYFFMTYQVLEVGSKLYRTVPPTHDNPFIEKIGPGETVRGRLAFDIPEGAKPTRLVLHDDPSSDGVTVRLNR